MCADGGRENRGEGCGERGLGRSFIYRELFTEKVECAGKDVTTKRTSKELCRNQRTRRRGHCTLEEGWTVDILRNIADEVLSI